MSRQLEPALIRVLRDIGPVRNEFVIGAPRPMDPPSPLAVCAKARLAPPDGWADIFLVLDEDRS